MNEEQLIKKAFSIMGKRSMKSQKEKYKDFSKEMSRRGSLGMQSRWKGHKKKGK